MSALRIFVFCFLTLSSLAQDAWFDLVRLNSSSALCLDGSPGAYYVSRDGDPKKIYLEFQGGGWCGSTNLQQTLQSCYQRSKTQFGSSLGYPASSIYNQGSLSIEEGNNFKGWKRVVLIYCDGSGHQGTRKQPVAYKGASLYFRGHNVTVEQLDSLQQKIGLFSQASQVVVGGDSAGGLASFLWSNYIAQRVKSGKVWGLPDSGIFYDSYNVVAKRPLYKQSLMNLMKISNVQIDPPVPECVKLHKRAKYNCMFAQNIYKHIKIPIFAIQSLYDSWCIVNILGITCGQASSLDRCGPSDRAAIQAYHQNVKNLLLMIGANQSNGLWAPACVNHVYGRGSCYYNQLFRIPANSQYSASKSVQNWLDNTSPNNIHIDLLQWPNNGPCSNKQISQALF